MVKGFSVNFVKVVPITFSMAALSQEEQLKLIQDLEIEMMADMYNRWAN